MIDGRTLYAWLTSAGVTAYSVIAPEGATLPYCVYRKVAGGWRDKDLARYVRFEVTCAAATYKDLNTMTDAIIMAAISATDVICDEGAEDYIDGMYTAILAITISE